MASPMRFASASVTGLDLAATATTGVVDASAASAIGSLAAQIERDLGAGPVDMALVFFSPAHCSGSTLDPATALGQAEARPRA